MENFNKKSETKISFSFNSNKNKIQINKNNKNENLEEIGSFSDFNQIIYHEKRSLHIQIQFLVLT